jgi:cytochrome c oxidase subunit 1
MLFAIGLIVEFTIGGLSGVTHAISPSDTQQTDTYYIVAHFHYVLFGGAIFGIFAGFYYWWPKIFGRMLSEKLGKWNFWLMVIGMNLTFGPMHIVGLEGQSRRNYRVIPGMGVSFWNLVETIGAFILATGILLFLINAVRTNLKPRSAALDPWDARTLEWMTNNPPKDHNFDAIPSVHSIDEFFHRKYEEDEESGDFTKVASAEEIMADQEAHREAHMHMPSPSYWPMVIAFGLPVVAIGLIFSHVISVVGALLIVIGAYGWVQEPSVAEVDDYDPPSDSTKELATVE